MSHIVGLSNVSAVAESMSRKSRTTDLALAEVIWNYHRLGSPSSAADCLLVLGGPDPRVAETGAELYHEGSSNTVVCSGGIAHQDDLLATGWDAPEAEVFADIMVSRGVPAERIWIEDRATNTGDNIRFSKRLLDAQGIRISDAILVVKPPMERRAVATAEIAWPEARFVAASQRVEFEDYPTADMPLETVVQIMVGDLQRLWVYADRGWQKRQDFPDDVLAAFDELVRRGYDRHCIRDAPMQPSG